MSSLQALSLRKTSTFVAIKAALEGKWQVSWCQLPLFSILVYEESDGNKAQVNKGTETVWPLRELVTVSDPSGSLHNGTQDKQHPDKDVSPARAACKLTGAETTYNISMCCHNVRKL